MDRSPWEFRLRSSIAFIIYFTGFYVGYFIDHALGGKGIPTFVLLGRHLGHAGIQIVAEIAAVLGIAGFLIRWWGSSYHQAGVVFSGQIETQTLTASGPYRFVRNPLYLGNMLQGIGISSLGPPATTVIILVALTAFLYRLIFLEEAGLRQSQGAAYERYCAMVPRLIPRLVPAPMAQSRQRPNPAYGFVTELGSLGFAIWLSYFGFVDPEVQTLAFWRLFYLAIALFLIGGVINRRMSRTTLNRRGDA